MHNQIEGKGSKSSSSRKAEGTTTTIRSWNAREWHVCVCVWAGVLKTGKMEIGKQTKQTEHGLENEQAHAV